MNLSNPSGAVLYDAQGKATLTALQITALANPPLRISFTTASGRSYALESAATLLGDAWSSAPGFTNILGTGGVVTVTNGESATEPGEFFRIRVKH